MASLGLAKAFQALALASHGLAWTSKGLDLASQSLARASLGTGVIARLGVKIKITLGFSPVLHTMGVYYQCSKAF